MHAGFDQVLHEHSRSCYSTHHRRMQAFGILTSMMKALIWRLEADVDVSVHDLIFVPVCLQMALTDCPSGPALQPRVKALQL